MPQKSKTTTTRLPARYMTVAEVADTLRRTKAAIYVSRDRGSCPGRLGVAVGSRVLFDPDLIARWIEAGGRADWSPDEEG